MIKFKDIKEELNKLEFRQIDKIARTARHQHIRGNNGSFISIYTKNTRCKNHPNRKAICLELCSSCYYQNIKKYNKDKIEVITKLGKIKSKKLRLRYLKLIELKQKSQKRDYALRKKYGITLEQYEELFEKQHGKCVLCNKMSGKRLSVDHNHKTGAVRGLLCFRCNYGIGYFKENILTFKKIIKYLRREHA